MKYNINDVESLEELESITTEKFPSKKGSKKMKKHQDSESKKKERRASRHTENLEYVLSEETED